MTLLKFNQSSGWTWWCKFWASGHSDASPSPDSGSEMKVSDRGFHLSGSCCCVECLSQLQSLLSFLRRRNRSKSWWISSDLS